MKEWFSKDHIKITIFLLVIALAAFFRLYQISGYMNFLGDEGRDALIVKDILVGRHIPFIGPPSSVGNVYLGPLYYYMMAFSMAVWWLNPVAASIMVALIGTATVGLIFYIGNKWFGFWAGFTSALLYAVSPVNINYSRSSWNPNPAPFFATLAIYFYSLTWEKYQSAWVFISGLATGAAVQMHYLSLTLIPIIMAMIICQSCMLKKRSILLIYPVTFLLGFLLILTPWLLFELKHSFLNTRGLLEIMSGSSASITFSLKDIIFKIGYVFSYNLISRYITGENFVFAAVISLIILFQLIYQLQNKGLSVDKKYQYIILGFWLLVGSLGLTLYKYELYDHYLGFLNPAPYLVIGSVSQTLSQFKNRKVKEALCFTFCLIISVIIYVNLQSSPLRFPPNRQLERTQQVAQFIIQKSGYQPFNFALLANRNYDSAYQFFLDKYGYKPQPLPVSLTGQLFVVCEDNPCAPVGNPKYEIAAFGWAKIESSWEESGLKIYKLVPNPSGKSS